MNIKVIITAIVITYIIAVTIEYIKLKRNFNYLVKETSKLLEMLKALPGVEINIEKK